MVKFCVYLLFSILFYNNTCFSYSGGNGSETDPYKISNSADLQLLMNTNSDWDKNFILTNDIDCTGMTDAKPIGNSKYYVFKGSFDGHNFGISNLEMDFPNTDYVAFIGNNQGIICNLKIVNCKIIGNNYIGGFCSVNAKQISNCFSSGSVDGVSVVGGFCGSNFGNLSNSSSDCTVTGVRNVGGFCGWSKNSSIYNCFSSGNVNSNKGFAGGFCGVSNAEGTPNQYEDYYPGYTYIYSCYSTGNVVSNGDFVGGFCGSNSAYTAGFNNINNCYAVGNVHSNGNKIGGFCGENLSSKIKHCYSIGNVQSKGNNIGGFCGNNTGISNPSIVSNCYWDIETSGLDTSDGGSGKTTAEMFTQSTFNAWDFINTWYMPVNDYPKLYPSKTETSVETETIASFDFNIYPNPTNGYVYISFDILKSGKVSIELYDILGSKVLTTDLGYRNPGQNQTEINIDNIRSGMYQLILKIDDKIYSKIIVKSE
jgi:hypothetical protein